MDDVVTSADTSVSTEELPVTEITDAPEIEAPPSIDFKGTKHKFKANGKEIEVDYDDLLSKAAKAEGADQKFQEAAQARKQIQEMEAKIGRLSKADEDNFLEMVEVIGFEKAKKFANAFVRSQLEWEELSDDQREQVLHQRKIDEDLAELERYKAQELTSQQLKAKEQAYNFVDKEVGEALAAAKAEGLSIAESPKFAEMVVDELLAYLEYVDIEEAAGRPINVPPPSALDVARSLQARSQESMTSTLKKLKAKDLRSMLTPEQLEELRQSELDELYAGTIPRQTSKRQPGDEPINPFKLNSNTRPAKESGDFFKRMDNHFGMKR